MSAFISRLKDSNVVRSLPLLVPVFLALAWILFLLRIFLLISGVIQGIVETDLLIFEGICFIMKTRLFNYTENFTMKKWKFSDKKILIFVIFLLKTIYVFEQK